MRYSGIGGQAIMEGVMMRNGNSYAVAVRLPDQSIHVDVHQVKGIHEGIQKIPIVRGVYTFFWSLIIGLGSLMESASYFEEEGDAKVDKQNLSEEEQKKLERKEKAEMGGTLLLSFVLALGIFMALPYGISALLGRFIANPMLTAFIEGVLRVVIFILYIAIISKTDDIKRTFMYHGAEHKCINCIESGLELTVENVRKSTRLHKRCGTSFLFIVLLISIFIFMFIRMDSHLLQLVLRLLLVPVIAGISYEFIRLAGRTENKLINALSQPGLWMQKLTTKEPDDDMIKVGIASVEAVFDWKSFLEGDEARCSIS
ncbi:MAG: DUF1385 domain-containing protein [Lachnospiraceae bacterium]|nr:DUF1385 domain-containing protein [Lachnospiraceae bacterium]